MRDFYNSVVKYYTMTFGPQSENINIDSFSDLINDLTPPFTLKDKNESNVEDYWGEYIEQKRKDKIEWLAVYDISFFLRYFQPGIELPLEVKVKLEETLKTIKTRNNKKVYQQYWVLFDLLRIYLAKSYGDYQRVVRLAYKGYLKATKKLNDPSGNKIIFLSHLIRTDLVLGNYDNAMSYYEKTRKIKKKSRSKAWCMLLLMRMAMNSKNFDLALEFSSDKSLSRTKLSDIKYWRDIQLQYLYLLTGKSYKVGIDKIPSSMWANHVLVSARIVLLWRDVLTKKNCGYAVETNKKWLIENKKESYSTHSMIFLELLCIYGQLKNTLDLLSDATEGLIEKLRNLPEKQHINDIMNYEIAWESLKKQH